LTAASRARILPSCSARSTSPARAVHPGTTCSPAMARLPDVRTLIERSKDFVVHASNKSVRPPRSSRSRASSRTKARMSRSSPPSRALPASVTIWAPLVPGFEIELAPENIGKSRVFILGLKDLERLRPLVLLAYEEEIKRAEAAGAEDDDAQTGEAVK